MDIKNLNIWKEEDQKSSKDQKFLRTDITELNLSVRSFHCLKRANCDTIQDVLNCIGEDGQGLRRIRNLGSRSEKEILEKLEEYQKYCDAQVIIWLPKKCGKYFYIRLQ